VAQPFSPLPDPSSRRPAEGGSGATRFSAGCPRHGLCAWVLGFHSFCEPACPLRPRRHPRATKSCHSDRIISDCPVINDE